ncbi:MFS transporter [Gymnodinialimonas sp.]
MSNPWRPVLVVCPLCFCAGGLYGWSALIDPLQAQFGVSTAQTGLVFSLAIVCFTAAVIGTPHVLPQWHPLRRVAAFGVGAAFALILALAAPSYPLFVLFFSGGFGTLSGAIYVASVTISAQSPYHRMATPLMVASFGQGGAVFGPLWRLLGEAWGLSAIWPLVICLALASLAIEARPKDQASAPPTLERAKPVRSTPPRVVFPLIWAIFALGSFAGLMVLGLAAKMLDVASAPAGLASLTLAGIAIGNTGGRLSVAGFTRVITPITVVFVATGLGIFGLAMTLLAHGAGALALGLCVIAGGYGVIASAIPNLVRATYGAAEFQRRFSRIFLAWGFAGFCAPWVGAALFDRTGTFQSAVVLAMLASLACGVAAVLLLRVMSRLPDGLD